MAKKAKVASKISPKKVEKKTKKSARKVKAPSKRTSSSRPPTMTGAPVPKRIPTRRPRGGSKPGRSGDGGTISVRMYRGLLGDFFFVRHELGDKQFKMLIDCGVLQRIGTEKAKPSTTLGKSRIVDGVQDFLEACEGSIDLMVATHEHYDHLSGFIHANDSFADFKIGKVWMAWTEDRTDKVANGYRNKKRKALAALAMLADNPAFAASGEMETVRNLLQFHGPIEAAETRAMAAAMPRGGGRLPGNSSIEGVLEWLRQRAGMKNVSFLKPGEVVRWGVDDAFRGYVLGPPRDDERLRQLDPSKGASKEVYLARGEDVEMVTGLAALHGGGARSEHLNEIPFSAPYRNSYDAGGKKRKRGKGALDQAIRIYEQGDELSRLRRIDAEWLGSAENLALKIDGDVNNTSLALALELNDEKILLFPGDAQVGNWLSWGDQTYPDEKERKLSIDELLARTVLYKVGHHASHNATLRDRGLELMTNPDLCAMIPVVEKTAREQKTKNSPKGWAMPYGDLYDRLDELSQGRIVRGDGDTVRERRSFTKSIFDVSYGKTVRTGDPLWVQLTLKL